jgi:transcription antitermination factor NusG
MRATPAAVSPGDRVRVVDGTFAGYEGEVMAVMAEKGLVRLELRIFRKPVPVELENWQVTKLVEG